MRSPIPAWVVAGPLGCGKTTLIARLLAEKPPEEHWAVLLNEFSDAGIDALTVAAAARGAYDVRMVPGGCICCAGEADFRRNLLELVAAPVRPARIIVEPSGIGHPAGIVEELLMHQANGGLRLEAVIGLVDVDRVRLLRSTDDEPARAVAEIADLLALTKADLADSDAIQSFFLATASLYPPKRWFGSVTRGSLPAAAWAALEQGAHDRALSRDLRRPDLHQHAREHAATTHPAENANVEFGRRDVSVLGHIGAAWRFPRSQSFSLERLRAAFATGSASRIKAVVRVTEDEWSLVQRVGEVVTVASTAWRRDNRIEVLCDETVQFDAHAWEQRWASCMNGS